MSVNEVGIVALLILVCSCRTCIAAEDMEDEQRAQTVLFKRIAAALEREPAK